MERELKFLVVAYSLAPLNVISAQRLNSLVHHLTGRGHVVEVLTSVKSHIDGPLDAFRQWDRLRSVAKVHEVEFLGRRVGPYRGRGQRPRGRSSAWSGQGRQLMQRLRAAFSGMFGALFDYRTVWAMRAIRYYRNNLRGEGYDVVITTSGPVSANLVGAAICKLSPGAIWVADFRDLWSLLHSSNTWRLTKKLERVLEVKLLRSASLITTVSQDLARQMEALHFPTPVTTIRNGFDAEELADIVPDRGAFESAGCGDKFNIVYAGSVYPRRRDPSRLLEALAANGHRQNVALHFFGFNLGGIPSLVEKYRIADCCFVHGARTREEILAIQKAADLNLFLESGEPDAAGVITGKLFELAALERPILSLGPQAGFESMDILRRTGLLVRWEETTGIDDVIEQAGKVSPSANFISTLEREKQFERLLEDLRPLVPSRGSE